MYRETANLNSHKGLGEGKQFTYYRFYSWVINDKKENNFIQSTILHVSIKLWLESAEDVEEMEDV